MIFVHLRVTSGAALKLLSHRFSLIRWTAAHLCKLLLGSGLWKIMRV